MTLTTSSTLGSMSGQFNRSKGTGRSVKMNNFDFDKIAGTFGGTAAAELRRMEQERSSWMRGIAESQSLAKQMKTLLGETSLETQLLKQWREWEKAERESVRKILDPMQDIRNGFLADRATRQMLDDLARPLSMAAELPALVEQTTGARALRAAMQSSLVDSLESARTFLNDASVRSGIRHVMKNFKEANERWIVPEALLDSLGPLRALQEQIGKLSLPVMDAASAATLARVLGPEGIQAQLVELGINPDGPINVQLVPEEKGIGLSRKQLELMQLLSFIFAILIPIWQEYSTSQWQAAADKKLEAQAQETRSLRDALERQQKVLEGLSKLVERALVQEAKRREARFVVMDRVVVVRSKPEPGSSVQGKLLPREVVRPISEHGKWIEFEYYHWLHRQHCTGWALKKYFQRVPATFDGPDSEDLQTK